METILLKEILNDEFLMSVLNYGTVLNIATASLILYTASIVTSTFKRVR